ncbi:ATP-binding protein [Candidatus Marinamargulisbacteria bacterium]|nr:ATP-binding protein [Candidatus Marinamargulisbacteria bacterium]
MNDLLNLNIDTKTLRVKNKECSNREFKLQFENDKLWKYAKTMAAFANKDGGIIFFGIKDNPRELVGIKGAEPSDLTISHFINAYFEPEISFELGSEEYGEKTLMYLLVRKSPNKPIICKKKKLLKSNTNGQQDKVLLREGAIYYRYSSASEEIRHPELKEIIDVRSRSIYQSMIDNITLIEKVGYDKAAIVNASELSGNNKATSVYVTTETAKKINWIRKGKFSESDKEGEKAYYVTKEIEVHRGVEIEKPVDPGKTHPLTKIALSKQVDITQTYLDTVLESLRLLNNEKYHLSSKHGKNNQHNFTQETIKIILSHYPLDDSNRKNKIGELYKKRRKPT